MPKKPINAKKTLTIPDAPLTADELGMLATWEGLFGQSEAIRRGVRLFHAADVGAEAADLGASVPEGQVEAALGVSWTDPTFAIFYNLFVNNQMLGPGASRTGDLVHPFLLRRGQANKVGWSVKHTAQGWEHRVFLRVGDRVIELQKAEDPSDATTDDITKGFHTINVPA